jgi:GNAT superfamily N-acetyltransferase
MSKTSSSISDLLATWMVIEDIFCEVYLHDLYSYRITTRRTERKKTIIDKQMATSTASDSRWKIDIVNENDLIDLLPLLQAYCAFYNQTEQIPVTTDDALLSVSRALIANPTQEGLQLIARDAKDRTPVGFATIFWSWSTLKGGRLAIMNDLFVDEQYRGQGIADILIGDCARRAREHGAGCLTWQTSVDNKRAQTVYNRSGALKSDRWLNYFLDL